MKKLTLLIPITDLSGLLPGVVTVFGNGLRVLLVVLAPFDNLKVWATKRRKFDER